MSQELPPVDDEVSSLPPLPEEYRLPRGYFWGAIAGSVQCVVAALVTPFVPNDDVPSELAARQMLVLLGICTVFGLSSVLAACFAKSLRLRFTGDAIESSHCFSAKRIQWSEIVRIDWVSVWGVRIQSANSKMSIDLTGFPPVARWLLATQIKKRAAAIEERHWDRFLRMCLFLPSIPESEVELLTRSNWAKVFGPAVCGVLVLAGLAARFWPHVPNDLMRGSLAGAGVISAIWGLLVLTTPKRGIRSRKSPIEASDGIKFVALYLAVSFLSFIAIQLLVPKGIYEAIASCVLVLALLAMIGMQARKRDQRLKPLRDEMQKQAAAEWEMQFKQLTQPASSSD